MATNCVDHELEDSESDEDLDVISLGDNDELDKVLTEDEIKGFNEEVKTMPRSIKVVCSGPTGVGKSTLLNGLMGVDEFSDDSDSILGEQDSESVSSFRVESSLDHGTLSVTQKTFTKHDIQITLFDTPGLEGCSDTDNAYLREIKEKCADYDLFLYCISSTDTRSTELFDEKSSLVKFTKLFGPKLWNHAVIVLTRANALEADLEEEKEIDPAINVEEAFKGRISEWSDKIRKELRNLGVRKRKIKKLPILPAGTAISPDLPGHPLWLSKLFEKVINQMNYKAKMAYIRYSQDRLTTAEGTNVKDIGKEDIGKQPFVLTRKFKWLAAISSALTGSAGAITGAGIGATIGALAIGIPSFGTVAIVGLVVGGAIGAAVGGSSSTAAAVAFYHFRKKRCKEKKIKK